MSKQLQFVFSVGKIDVQEKKSGVVVCLELTMSIFSCTTCDDEPLAFKKMYEFSSVDGFAEITESLAEMIKLIANEPSMGLFYIQQHTQSAVPIISLKNDIEERSCEVILHAEDSETVLRSIKDTCSPIANEMIKDLRHSLAVMLKKQPKKDQ